MPVFVVSVRVKMKINVADESDAFLTAASVTRQVFGHADYDRQLGFSLLSVEGVLGSAKKIGGDPWKDE